MTILKRDENMDQGATGTTTVAANKKKKSVAKKLLAKGVRKEGMRCPGEGGAEGRGLFEEQEGAGGGGESAGELVE